MTATQGGTDDLRSRTIGRLLDVLEQLSVAPHPLTNLALAKRLGVPPSSMFRLLQKLVELGYADFDAAESTYAVSGRLGELGERLADAGCRSQPMRELLTGLRERTGHNIMVWVPNGLHVRLAVVVSGRHDRGKVALPGEIRLPFSTPGLAIAMTMPETEVRARVQQCRKRNMELGNRFHSASELLQGLRTFREIGYVPGYNLMADGWAMLAWPIPIPVGLDPQRYGAVAIGSRASLLRREEEQVVRIAEPLLTAYRNAVSRVDRSEANQRSRLRL